MINWFSKLRRKELEPIDFSILKTDMHSHLIPSIDDGPQSVKESIDLIKSLQELGFSKLITTPHTMIDCYNNTPEIILNGLEDLKFELEKLKMKIPVHAASEYYVDFEFQESIKVSNLLTFGAKYILIEFPFLQQPREVDEVIFQLQLAGYNVVLAHPERYLYYTIQDLKKLTEKGVFLQLNLLSITGYYSDKVKKSSEKLIKEDLISFVGTDCHNNFHAEKLKECFTNPLWHQLSQSERLLNKTL